MTWTCDGKFIKDNLEEIGETIIIKSIDTEDYNKWGDATKTYIETSVIAVIRAVSDDEAFNTESVFNSRDIVMTISGDQEALVITGNLVVYDGDDYKIDRVVKHRASGITYLIEATLEKV